MRYLGLDLGTKTLGLSISDKTGMIASNYGVLKHDEDYDYLITVLGDIITKEEIEALVLGFPKNMDNSIGMRASIALEFKEKLEKAFNLPVYMQDERLSTVEAEKMLISNDESRKKRKKVIDSIAAVIILQSYLDGKGR